MNKELELKSEVDNFVAIISYLMKEIMVLDKVINEIEDPNHAVILAELLEKKGERFHELSAILEHNLKEYINYMSENNLPLPLSYMKLQKQIRG